MASRMELLREARSRGILPPDLISMVDEAERRGLLQQEKEEEEELALPINPQQPSIQRTVREAGVTETGALTGERADPGPESDLDPRAIARPVAIGVGETLGAIGGGIAGAAATGGPGAIPGAVAGSAAGAGGASLLFDKAMDLAQEIDPDFERFPGSVEGSEEQLRSAATEAVMGAAFTTGGALAFPVKRMLTPLLGKIFGVRSQRARNAAEVATRQGIGLAAVDVGGPGARILSRVLGVFPFTGSPFRKFRTVKEAQATKRFNQILDEFAPTSIMAGELGIDMAKAAGRTDARFNRIAGKLYQRFRDLTDDIGPIVPTSETKSKIVELADDFRAGQIPIPGDAAQVLKGGLDESFEKFLTDAQNLPEMITTRQQKVLKERLKGFIEKVGDSDKFTIKRASEIKAAMDADMLDLNVSGLASDLAKRILAAKRDADTFFANGILRFQTATAKKFRKADPGFGGRFAGEKGPSINVDELNKSVFNADSAGALGELRGLIGKREFGRAVRNHLDDVMAKSFKKEVRGGENVLAFDPDAFTKNLGLVEGNKDRTLALGEMFKGSKTTVKDLREFAEAARIAKINDPSAFITRRVTLGGIGAVAAIGGIGGAAAGAGLGPVGVLIVALGARKVSKILADPEALKALTRSFRPGISEAQKRALMVRVLRQIGETTKNQAELEREARS